MVLQDCSANFCIASDTRNEKLVPSNILVVLLETSSSTLQNQSFHQSTEDHFVRSSYKGFLQRSGYIVPMLLSIPALAMGDTVHASLLV